MPVVELPESVYAELKALGGTLFSVPEVIGKLLPSARRTETQVTSKAEVPVSANGGPRLSVLSTRAPRERGVTVVLAGKRIQAGTVSDLYEQAFNLIHKSDKSAALGGLVPFRTSNQRYLISREPQHPNGNPFFAAVKVGPYHIETHKNYEQAVNHLAAIVGRLGMTFQYVP